jgi:tetratricopeptide (TPR) repeat protein
MYLVWVYLIVGDTSQALEQLRLMLGSIEQTGQVAWLNQVYLFQSWCRSRPGEHALAEADLARIQQSDASLYYARVLFHAIQTEIALNAGQYQQALTLAEQTVAVARAVSDLSTEGSAQRVWAQALAILEPSAWTAVDQHFAESLRAFAEGGARLEAARTHVAWGKTLAQRGEPQRAGEHFAEAAMQFATSGLTRELAEVRKLIGNGAANTVE